MAAESLERTIGEILATVKNTERDVTELKSAFQMLESGRVSKLEREMAAMTVKMAMIAAAVPITVQFAILLFQHYVFK